MPLRPVPPGASIADPREGARLFAPSAARNAGPILDVLRRVAPSDGTALEIASGTGQHVTAFARALPGLRWQPSDIAPERRASIDALVADAGLGNVAPALELDAVVAGWGKVHAGHALILVVNLLHLVSWPEAEVLLAESACALRPGGRMVIYGPFLRDGEFASETDRRFHADLTARDPDIGYKDTARIRRSAAAAGLVALETVAMPADNLLLVFARPAR